MDSFLRGGLVLAALSLLLAPACDEPTALAPSEGDDDDDTTGAQLFAVEGLVRDPSGTPAVGLTLSVSTEFCIAGVTDADGRFRVEDVSPGPKRLISYASTAGFQWPSFSAAFEAPDDGADFEFAEELVVPSLDEQIAVDPDSAEVQVVELAGSLGLIIEPGALSLAPLADPMLLSGALEPSAAAALWDLPPDALSVVAIEPILSRFDPPAQVEVDTPPLEPGTELGLWSADYDTGTLVQEATLTVGASGASATSAPGTGITMLGWHVIAPLEAP